MSCPALDAGVSLQTQFKKAIVAAGPLKGAPYLEVGWDDLRRAAKGYKADPRFHQFARRCMSEKAFGPEKDSDDGQTSPQTWTQALIKRAKTFGSWLLSRAKLRLGLSLALAFLLVVLMSRPLFYVVLVKTLTMGVRLCLRRSMGLVAAILDAFLDEAVVQLDSALSPPPMIQQQGTQQVPPQFHVQSMNSFTAYLLHGLFTLMGVLIGHRLPRSSAFARTNPPTRLRVV